MNHYTQLLYYIKQLAEADDLVNCVTKGDLEKLDNDNSNTYPLVHINVFAGAFSNGSTNNFDVQVGAFAKRDINKEVNTDKFWRQDNEVDNHNETNAILNRIWLKMYRDFEENNITASENPTLDKVSFQYANLLDGWILNFTVEMPNDIISLCDAGD